MKDIVMDTNMNMNMNAQVSQSVGHAVKDVLNVRRSDYFVSYGMGPIARDVVDLMREFADVSSGIALDAREYKECDALRTMIYKGMREFGAKKLFDRVYCNYSELFRSARILENVFDNCYDLCAEKGMVYITGIESNPRQLETMLERRHITKYWFFRETDSKCDILYKKEGHFER